jgi:hypothetical protein
VIGLYYYGEVTMKQIGAQIGVNESRVSQLHARAIRRMRDVLGDVGPEQVAELRLALENMSTLSTMSAVSTKSTISAVSTTPAFAAGKPVMAKAALPEKPVSAISPLTQIVKRAAPYGVVLPYKPVIRKTAHTRAALKMSRPRHASAAAR